MARRQQMLATVLDPLDRRAQLQRQPGDDNLLRVDLRLDAKATAHVGGHDAHGLLVQAEQLGHHFPQAVRDLGGRPQRDPPVSAARGKHTAWFDRRASNARAVEPTPIHEHVGPGEALVDRADFDLAPQIPVIRELGVQSCRARPEGRLGVDDHLVRLILHGNGVEGVLGSIATLRHDRGDRLAREADGSAREHGSSRANRVGHVEPGLDAGQGAHPR